MGVLILGHFLSDGLDEIFPLDKVANIVEVALSEILQTMISILELTSGIDTRQPVISFLELFQFFMKFCFLLFEIFVSKSSNLTCSTL